MATPNRHADVRKQRLAFVVNERPACLEGWRPLRTLETLETGSY
jgi:hypothetical protein